MILEANYLNPSFCRVYYWWLGGFGMLIGAREGVARVLAVACELIAVACKSMPVACSCLQEHASCLQGHLVAEEGMFVSFCW